MNIERVYKHHSIGKSVIHNMAWPNHKHIDLGFVDHLSSFKAFILIFILRKKKKGADFILYYYIKFDFSYNKLINE